MSRKKVLTRRDFLHRALWGSATIGLVGVSACSDDQVPGNPAEGPVSEGMPGDKTARKPGPVDCASSANLSEQEKSIRESQDYQDDSPKQGKFCHNCERFTAPHEARNTQCGHCDIIPGPISPGGWCQSWTKKTG